MSDTKGIKIVHLNIRSLIPKIDLLRAWVALHKLLKHGLIVVYLILRLIF